LNCPFPCSQEQSKQYRPLQGAACLWRTYFFGVQQALPIAMLSPSNEKLPGKKNSYIRDIT